jgi:hypothetical protein
MQFSDVDWNELSGELVNNVEHLEGAQVARLVELEVHGSYDVGYNGTHHTYLNIKVGEPFHLAIGVF